MSWGGLQPQAAIARAARTAVRAIDAVMMAASIKYTRILTRRR
jgi:hypothetical protein